MMSAMNIAWMQSSLMQSMSAIESILWVVPVFRGTLIVGALLAQSGW